MQNSSNLSKNVWTRWHVNVCLASTMHRQNNGHLVQLKDLPTHCLTALTIVWRTYQQLSLTRVLFVATESSTTVNNATAAKILCHKYVGGYIGLYFWDKLKMSIIWLTDEWAYMNSISQKLLWLYDAWQPILAPKLQTNSLRGFIT